VDSKLADHITAACTLRTDEPRGRLLPPSSGGPPLHPGEPLGILENRSAGAVITKAFFSAKDFCAYEGFFLRQEKTLRDHGAGAATRCGHGD